MLQPSPSSTSLIWPWHQEGKWVKQPSSVIVGPCPHWESRSLSHPGETGELETALPFPNVAVHPCRPSSSCRANVASSADPAFSNSPGCGSHGLQRATASSHYGLVAQGHACPKRSYARACFLHTSHSLEPQSLPYLVIQQSSCFSPKPVTQHMDCHSLGGKELKRFAWGVMLDCWRPSQSPQHPSSYAFATLLYFLLPSAYTWFSLLRLWLL